MTRFATQFLSPFVPKIAILGCSKLDFQLVIASCCQEGFPQNSTRGTKGTLLARWQSLSRIAQMFFEAHCVQKIHFGLFQARFPV
jgi:hypothetical protein